MRNGLVHQLVGACEQCGRHVEAKSFGRFEVDYQLEFGRLQDRQIAWLGTFENPTSIDADLAKHIGDTWSVACQASGGRKVASCQSVGVAPTRLLRRDIGSR